MKTILALAFIFVVLSCRRAMADLHPIVEVRNGYLFGAIADGKAIKADDVAKSMSDKTTYRVYGLTQSLGEAKGNNPKPEEVPCETMLSVPLSKTPPKAVIAVAGTWNAMPRKVQSLDTTQEVYVDAVRDFVKTKGIEQPQVKIDNLIRVDLDASGKMEIVVRSHYYEGEATTIYRCDPNKCEDLLSVGCGV